MKTVIFSMEGLILAQNERWRRGLGMQVERGLPLRGKESSGKRVSNAQTICLWEGDSGARKGLAERTDNTP